MLEREVALLPDLHESPCRSDPSVDEGKKEFGDILFKECFLVRDVGWKGACFKERTFGQCIWFVALSVSNNF